MYKAVESVESEKDNWGGGGLGNDIVGNKKSKKEKVLD